MNLEDILDDEITKRLSNEYIKVSLNDSTPRVLNTYRKVDTTITDADSSFKLTSGSLAPSGEDGDFKDYTLKLWMDYDTPALDETMNAVFKSKISVIATRIEEDALTNEIVISYKTKNTSYTSDKEEIEINAVSDRYDLIEYSTDNITYTSIDNPGKNVTITKVYTDDTEQLIYFHDEVGNLQKQSISLNNLDKTGPSIIVAKDKNNATLTFKDEKSGLLGYQILEEERVPDEYIEISGKEATVTKVLTANKKYYIYAKDVLGNISKEIVEIELIDDNPPVITSLTEQDDYGSSSIITAKAIDSESGIIGYAFTEEETEPSEWTSVDNVISESTYTYEATKNGVIYFWVKDGIGHVVHDKISVTKIDTTAPSITVSVSDETTWTRAKTLTINLSDADSGLAFYQVTNNWKTPSTWLETSGSETTETYEINSNDTYYIWAKDKAGLIKNITKKVTYIDRVLPDVQNVYVYGNNDYLTVNASSTTDSVGEIDHYEYSLDGTTYYTSSKSTYTFIGPFFDDSYQHEKIVHIKAIDKAGNEGYISRSAMIQTKSDFNSFVLSNWDYSVDDNYYNAYYNDGYDNIRFTYRYNYVAIDGELWRMIGIMKDVDDGTGNKSDRIKIVKEDSIGSYSWDSSSSSVNNGLGVNEWSQADLMKLLNPGYESESVGGSLYWNSKSGTCYAGENNWTNSCDFTNNGAKEELKSLIDNAVWEIGGTDEQTISQMADFSVKEFYDLTKSNGKICLGGSYCNDTIERTTVWTGKIGLISLSDYGYAINTDNGKSYVENFLNSKFSSLSGDSSYIYDNWLNYEIKYKNTQEFWTLNSRATFNEAVNVYDISPNSATLSFSDAGWPYQVYPTAYLKSNLKITGGTGDGSNPYVLSVD